MSGIKKRPISPRQKMINLMYVVLMAMLALNVSTDVLNGFSIVEESLNRTTANSSKENANIYSEFNEQMKQNPEKVKAWFNKAAYVKQLSDSLYNLADVLKHEIVRQADGEKGDVKNIRNKEDLESATHVMLGRGRGKHLYDAIVNYRTKILEFVTDKEQRAIIASNLTTDVPKNDGLPRHCSPSCKVTFATLKERYCIRSSTISTSKMCASTLSTHTSYPMHRPLYKVASSVHASLWPLLIQHKSLKSLLESAPSFLKTDSTNLTAEARVTLPSTVTLK